jgi:catechol 2,3-dioxygenase-like lactoylglutathione lyase family enzyme
MRAASPGTVHQERAMPVLTVLDLDEEARFYTRLGFEVLNRYDGYLLLARGDLELHLSHWEDHDPARTAGVVYLRVTDAQAIYDDLLAQLERDGCLYLAPASGLTPELSDQLRARVEAGTPTVRLHEIENKPWGLREFAVIDPSGNAIRIGHPIARH